MTKLLIVYNTCGIKEGDRSATYINHINSILTQDFSDFDLVISDCKSSPEVRQKLKDVFTDDKRVKYCWINDIIPVNPSFNFAVLRSCRGLNNKIHHDLYDGYMYVDSGIKLFKTNLLSLLLEQAQTEKYGIVSAKPDGDIGFHYEKQPDLSQNWIVPVGKSLNCHCQIFSSDYFNFYERLLPDIFAGHCSESVLSFCCAALQKQWVLVSDAEVEHVFLDGQSSGFDIHQYMLEKHKPPIDHPFILDSLVPMFINRIAIALGLGYEECRGVVMHDPSQYDENHHCKNNYLKYYIKEHLFLQPNQFDYNKVNHELIC